MALWAAHDCSDWDLYLTFAFDGDTIKHTLTFTGAEPSDRRECGGVPGGIGACEFYLPHGGDNFGILFTGGFHAIWHEHEWVYNPQWSGWFGGF